MPGKYVAPSVGLTAFSCPHCGTLTSQVWLPFFSQEMNEAWNVFRPENLERLRAAHKNDPDYTRDMWAEFEGLSRGEVIVENIGWSSRNIRVNNVAASKCEECGQVGLWVFDRLIWPLTTEAPEPNPDLPPDIAADYREAGSILSPSPRGAAALLRLSLQKLCQYVLGEDSQKTIDRDIATLVSKGLDRRIQQALDIVRVVGNEAVHPGTMDLRDDRSTAEELFKLLNLIADAMITQPRRIDEMYGALPEAKREAIERRDAPKLLPPVRD